MVIFYKKWKKYNEIQLTNNKMDLNIRKMTNHRSKIKKLKFQEVQRYISSLVSNTKRLLILQMISISCISFKIRACLDFTKIHVGEGLAKASRVPGLSFDQVESD